MRVAGRVVRVGLGPAVLALASLLLAAPPALGHPLGNFTINHYTGLRVAPREVLLDHVIDMAEIPAFSERRRVDPDGDGTLSTADSDRYTATACDTARDTLRLDVAGRPVPLQVIARGVSFPAGIGGLTTLRLVCVYRAALADPIAPGTRVAFRDDSYPDRIGWREIVVQGDGMTAAGAGIRRESVSRRLTEYPTDLLAEPLADTSVAFTATPGGPTLPVFSTPDAAPVGAPPDTTEPPTRPAAVPGGLTDLPPFAADIFRAPELSPSIVVLGLLLAAGIGALHALTPGHGKTVMAAYLIGARGDTAKAVGLGLAVAVSHTIGVLILGLLSVFAATLIPGERVIQVLTVVSGLMVVGIGLYLLARIVHDRARDRSAHSHDHDHDHPHDHDHDHEHADTGEHRHGPFRHRHGRREGSDPVSWRGIFALGLAGGLVPSTAALTLLLVALSLGRPAFGVLLIGAFGLGMAAAMVAIGVALVRARSLLERMPPRPALARLGRAVPAATAVAVLCGGLLITGGALGQLRF